MEPDARAREGSESRTICAMHCRENVLVCLRIRNFLFFFMFYYVGVRTRRFEELIAVSAVIYLFCCLSRITQ